MQNPLLGDKSNIEFSIREQQTETWKSGVKGLPLVAQFQILDMSQNFEPFFGQQIPKAFYPKYAQFFRTALKDDPHISFIKKIPVFYPDSFNVLLWQFCMVCIIFAYFFYIPYKIAFTDTDAGRDPNNNPGVFTFLILSIILLSIDLLVSFNIGVYEHGQLIMDRKKIATSYLQWAFELDLLGVLSLIFALSFDYDYVRLLFFFRGYYVIRYFDKCDNLLQLRNNMKAAFTVFKLVIVILLVTHLMACIFYGTAINEENNGLNTWIVDNSYMEKGQTIDSQSYSTWDRYVISFYWSLTTVSTVGYGDITPKNDTEIAIALLTMVIAGMVFAFNVASIREVLVDINQKQVRYKGYEQVLNQYMVIKKISNKTQIRVREYFDYIWEEEKNRNHPVEKILINRLAPDLKEQLYFETYKEFLGSFIFVTQGYSEQMLRLVALEMQEDHYGPGDLINCESNEDNYLYYLLDGFVLISIKREQNVFDPDIKVDLIKKNKCFGQIPFFTGEQQHLQVKSIGCCSVYKLARSKFLNIISKQQNDFQIFHLLLSTRHSPTFYQKIDIICVTCEEYGHYPTHCPVTHYVADRKKLLSHLKIKQELNQRKLIKRKETIKYDALKNHNLIKSSITDFNNYQKKLVKKTMIRMSMIPYELIQNEQIQFDEDLHDEDQQEHFEGEIDEIKQMLQLIMKKMGIEQNTSEKQITQIQPYMPSKPTFDPTEISFEIDTIQNYEVFQPQFNFTTILRRLGLE